MLSIAQSMIHHPRFSNWRIFLGSGWKYLTGIDFRTFTSTPENVDSSKGLFGNLQDVDGDNVQYRMIGYQGLEFLSMTTYTSDNFKTWALKDLIAQTDTVTVLEGFWNVNCKRWFIHQNCSIF